MYIGIISNSVPTFVVIIPLVLLVALFEMIGLKTRHNIAVLSMLSLLCLGAAVFLGEQRPNTSESFYAVGVVPAAILALYALVTSRRGRQQVWFAGLLIVVAATLGGIIVVRMALAQQDAADAATVTFILTLAVGALVYGLFAPDIPKPRGGGI